MVAKFIEQNFKLLKEEIHWERDKQQVWLYADDSTITRQVKYLDKLIDLFQRFNKTCGPQINIQKTEVGIPVKGNVPMEREIVVEVK